MFINDLDHVLCIAEGLWRLIVETFRQFFFRRQIESESGVIEFRGDGLFDLVHRTRKDADDFFGDFQTMKASEVHGAALMGIRIGSATDRANRDAVGMRRLDLLRRVARPFGIDTVEIAADRCAVTIVSDNRTAKFSFLVCDPQLGTE